MEHDRTIRLNCEAMRRARAAQNLSQRALARITDIRIAQLISMEQGGGCEKITLGSLCRLAEALCVDAASLLSRTSEPRPAQPDDVQVEAILAQVGKAVNRDDIAWALSWEIERVNAALVALERRLEGTGQRLRRAKFGWFGLAAAGDVLDAEKSANSERATFSEYGIQLRHARILSLLAEGKKIRQTHANAGTGTRGHNPVGELLRANLIGIGQHGIAISEDVAFSLCLDAVETAPAGSLRPQDRNPRAGYSINRQQRKTGEAEK